MSWCPRLAVAPNFHLAGGLPERLLLADGAGWRGPNPDEQAALAPQHLTPEELNQRTLLFVLPGHLRAAFWSMLEADATCRDFPVFASEVGRFLAFKQLPAPEQAGFELVLHGPGGVIDPRRLWAVVNLGDDPLLLGLPETRLRLGPGEGARLPEDVAAEVLPPDSEGPGLLLVVRRPG